MASGVTGDKSLDRRGNPAVKETTGGWESSSRNFDPLVKFFLTFCL